MTSTMTAAVVHEFGAPLVVEEVPRPEPGTGQVLVRVEAAGLCHTDIHAARGEWPVKATLPLIPGHEGVGVVEAGEALDRREPPVLLAAGQGREVGGVERAQQLRLGLGRHLARSMGVRARRDFNAHQSLGSLSVRVA